MSVIKISNDTSRRIPPTSNVALLLLLLLLLFVTITLESLLAESVHDGSALVAKRAARLERVLHPGMGFLVLHAHTHRHGRRIKKRDSSREKKRQERADRQDWKRDIRKESLCRRCHTIVDPLRIP